MCKRLFYLIIFVLALGFAAGVSTAAEVVYTLTEGSDPPRMAGTVTLDLDGAVPDESADGVDTYAWGTEAYTGVFNAAIVDFSLWQLASPDAYYEPSDIIQTWHGMYVKLASSTHATLAEGTPVGLFVDIDNVPNGTGGMYGTLDFTIVGNQYFDTQGDVTDVAFAPLVDWPELGEDPADGSTVGIDLAELKWVLPDSNEPETGFVVCDVWFATEDDYLEAGLYPDDPNFTDYATKIVGQVSPEEVEFVPIPGTLEKDHTYYWRIDTYDANSLPVNVSPVIGKVFIFDTYNQTPVVDFGSDRVVAWRIDGSLSFTLTADVTDSDGPVAVSHEWYVDNADDPEAGETANTIDLSWLADGEHVVRLEAYDGLDTGEAEVTIVVYADFCAAAHGEDLVLKSDFNGDCVTNLADFAEFAAEWLKRPALPAP